MSADEASELKLLEAAVEAEKQDNITEQERMRQKPVTYGLVVQLLHNMTNMFLHVSTEDAAYVDVQGMRIGVRSNSSKRTCPFFFIDKNNNLSLFSFKTLGSRSCPVTRSAQRVTMSAWATRSSSRASRPLASSSTSARSSSRSEMTTVPRQRSSAAIPRWIFPSCATLSPCAPTSCLQKSRKPRSFAYNQTLLLFYLSSFFFF